MISPCVIEMTVTVDDVKGQIGNRTNIVFDAADAVPGIEEEGFLFSDDQRTVNAGGFTDVYDSRMYFL